MQKQNCLVPTIWYFYVWSVTVTSTCTIKICEIQIIRFSVQRERNLQIMTLHVCDLESKVNTFQHWLLSTVCAYIDNHCWTGILLSKGLHMYCWTWLYTLLLFISFVGCYVSENEEKNILKIFDTTPWKSLLPVKKLSAHKQHYYEGNELSNCGIISHVRLSMAPDGGISRMRLWGYKQLSSTSRL